MPIIICLLLIFCGTAEAEIVRVVHKPDKTVVVLHYAPKSKLTRDEAFDRMIEKCGLEGLPYKDIDSLVLPSREDRGAWEWDNEKKVKINQVKAKQIKDAKKLEVDIKNKLREMAIDALNP